MTVRDSRSKISLKIGSVFCYGQTGSGKTHTMYGSKTDPGIAPRSLQYLYAQLKTVPESKVTISFLEIYNESINDLLEPSRKNIPLVETAKGVTQIRGLTECVCENLDDAEAVLKLGEKNRHIGITQANDKSSRSHTMFVCFLRPEAMKIIRLRINIEVKAGTDMPGQSGYVATINLVDLAGSECANTHLTGDKSGKMETGYINKVWFFTSSQKPNSQNRVYWSLAPLSRD